jgi:glycosyltransferase involved in cell wall biosynthesis
MFLLLYKLLSQFGVLENLALGALKFFSGLFVLTYVDFRVKIWLIQERGIMLNKKTISVVVPAYNEEQMIGKVIQTMPKFVDLIIVVDDASSDRTAKKTLEAAKKFKRKVELIKHKVNCGVGGAIVTGYKCALEKKINCTAVMAGDAQMAPEELESIVRPIIQDDADYVKGNRLIHGQAWRMIPRVRYLGNSVLSLFTKIASGYWHVADSQTGYTAISLKMLGQVYLDNLYKRYGFPNDLLVHLNLVRARVKEVEIKPIYYVEGKSGIRLWKVIPSLSWLLFRRFFWRLKRKYIIEDFHPLIFFYIFSFILNTSSVILLIRLIYIWIEVGRIPPINALALFFCLIMAPQFLFFAMWLDMDYNKDLKVK